MNSQGSSTMGRAAWAARPTGKVGSVPFRKTATKAPNGRRWRPEVQEATLAQDAIYRCVGCMNGHKGRAAARQCCGE